MLLSSLAHPRWEFVFQPVYAAYLEPERAAVEDAALAGSERPALLDLGAGCAGGGGSNGLLKRAPARSTWAGGGVCVPRRTDAAPYCRRQHARQRTNRMQPNGKAKQSLIDLCAWFDYNFRRDSTQTDVCLALNILFALLCLVILRILIDVPNIMHFLTR